MDDRCKMGKHSGWVIEVVPEYICNWLSREFYEVFHL